MLEEGGGTERRPCRARTFDTLIKSQVDIVTDFGLLLKLEPARSLFNFQTIRLTPLEKSGGQPFLK